MGVITADNAYDVPTSRLDMDQELRSAVQLAHRINADLDSEFDDEKDMDTTPPPPQPQPRASSRHRKRATFDPEEHYIEEQRRPKWWKRMIDNLTCKLDSKKLAVLFLITFLVLYAPCFIPSAPGSWLYKVLPEGKQKLSSAAVQSLIITLVYGISQTF